MLYAYRAGSPDQPDNRALRAAYELQVPIVHFVGTRPGWYRPDFPCFVARDDPASRFVLVTPGRMVGPVDEPEPVPVDDPIERRYLVRQTRVRMHQAQFRGRVLPAYLSQCAICRLKETRLLDAAHILGDAETEGEAVVSNGMSLCSIHHRAFDQHLLGVSPDYEVHASRRLLEDEDGPMLDLLKGLHRREIHISRSANVAPRPRTPRRALRSIPRARRRKPGRRARAAPGYMAGMEPRLVTPAFGLVVGATFAVFASFGMFIFAMPLYARDGLGASDVGVGLAMGAASVGAILAGPPSGRVSDRRGRRIVLFAGAAGMLLGYLALALEPRLSLVVPLRVAVGAAEAAFVVGVYTMAVDLAPERRRGEAMSLVTVGSYLGLALGPPFAGLVLGDDRFALAWIAAAALVAAAAALAAPIRETRSRHDGEAPAGWLPPRTALLPGVVLLFALIGFGGFNAFVVLHARELGVSHPGLVFIVFGAVVVTVRILGRRIPDRLGARLAASIACVTIAAGLAVTALWASEIGLFLGAAVFAAGQALAYPALVLLALSRAAPAERSAAVAAVAVFIDIALATGAFLLGIVAEVFDYRAVFAAGAISAVLGLVLLFRVRTAAAPATA